MHQNTNHAISNTISSPVAPIAHILTPFSQKFSIPRQGLSLSPAKGTIVFAEEFDVVQATDGIEDFSHLWLLFLFHKNIGQGFKAKVRPPRLGGNKKIGVFASRSSFRPNGIGMSLVKNLGMRGKRLIVEGVDLLNETPILDIKPYLPYADEAANAFAGYAQDKPSSALAVEFTAVASQQLRTFEAQYSDLPSLIKAVLAQDPRPSYKSTQQDSKIYFIRLYEFDIKWHVNDNTAHILEIYSFNKPSVF